jgi:tetratricopeptide (TPR) repeat protein
VRKTLARTLRLAAFTGVVGPALTIHAATQAPVTFTRDVAPILFANCTSCHQTSGIAPFGLRTYGDARPRAQAIARAVRARTMPPWKPEPLDEGGFVGERRLAPSEIDVIERWAAAGAPEGDPADLPPSAADTDGWQLGTPDLVVTLPEPYVLRAHGGDVLRNVIIPVPIAQSRNVRGLEFHPGNRRAVHHANIRVDRMRASRVLDDEDPLPGFDGGLTRAEFPDGFFLGWTPGQVPPLLPDGMSWRLEAGSDLVVQLHLHGTDTVETIQPSIGLYFTDRAPDRAPLMIRLGRQNIDIAPGQPAYRIEDHYTLPVDVTVLAVQPHAHFRARQVRGFVALPDGRGRDLIAIADWDFNWQDVYRFREPLTVPRGSTLWMQYTYDNSAANRRNPDVPPTRVRWGQNSSDEMGDLWIQVLTKNEEDRRRLRDDVGPKVMAEDAVGYEMLLQRDPANARLHEAVAALDLSLQRFDAAAAHLEAALRIDPRSSEAHYNLALALVARGRRAEAIAQLQRAIEIEPAHVAARVNLGALLRADGRIDEAVHQLRAAMAIEPASAAAHTNLAGALAAQGRLVEAIAEYRAALETRADMREPLVSLAWILAASPSPEVRRPDEAVRLAERAAALGPPQDLRALDTLAAAYAARGEFARALALVEPAARTARADGRVQDAVILEARAALYRKRMPYRDPALAPRP